MLSIWAGWLLDPEQPLLLVLDSDAELEKVLKLFLRTGYTKFAGYLAGGMKAWDNAGFHLAEVEQKTVHEVHEANGHLQVVDVRAPANGAADTCRAHAISSSRSFGTNLPNSIRPSPRPFTATAAIGPVSGPAF